MDIGSWVGGLLEGAADEVAGAEADGEREGEDDLRVAVDGGFMSVTEEGVSILAESAEFDSEIDEASAREDSESDDPRTAARGRARLRAVGALD